MDLPGAHRYRTTKPARRRGQQSNSAAFAAVALLCISAIGYFAWRFYSLPAQDLEGAAADTRFSSQEKEAEVVTETEPVLKEKEQVRDNGPYQYSLFQSSTPGHYYLAAVLFIPEEPRHGMSAGITRARIAQEWLEYAKYAGVEHVYVYSAASDVGESTLKHYLGETFVTLFDLKKEFPSISDSLEQNRQAHQHCVSAHGSNIEWLMAFDLEEFPFAANDVDAGFAHRSVKQLQQWYGNAGQLSVQALLHRGYSERKDGKVPGKHGALLIERHLVRRERTEGTSIDDFEMAKSFKPIFQPKNAAISTLWRPYKITMHTGFTLTVPADVLRRNCYWDQPANNGQDYTATLEDTSMLVVADRIRPALEKIWSEQ